MLDNGGTALIPVFAVGRSQEILAILYKHGLADRTYLDGMAKSATSIVLEYPAVHCARGASVKCGVRSNNHK